MSLYNRLQNIYDRTSGLKAGFDLPTTGAVTLITSEGSEVITPAPDVHTVNPRLVGNWLTDTVQLMGDEQELTISRRYERSQLADSEYMVNGRAARFLYVYDDKPLYWRVIVKPYEVSS